MTPSQRWVLITGASSGIGFHCAQALSADGFGVVITGRNDEQLRNALQALSTHSDRVMAFTCDQHNRDEIDRLLNTLPGPLTDVVANVGINPAHQHGAAKIHNTDFPLLDETLQVNVANTVYLLAPLLHRMRQQKFGRIVLVGSQAGTLGIPGQLAYNLSKASLIALARTCANEYGRHNIICQVLQLGIVLNNRTRKLRQRLNDESQAVTESTVARAIVSLLQTNNTALNGSEWLLPGMSLPLPQAINVEEEAEVVP